MRIFIFRVNVFYFILQNPQFFLEEFEVSFLGNFTIKVDIYRVFLPILGALKIIFAMMAVGIEDSLGGESSSLWSVGLAILIGGPKRIAGGSVFLVK